MHEIPEIIENKTAPGHCLINRCSDKKADDSGNDHNDNRHCGSKLFHMSLPPEIPVYTYIITFGKIKVK